jgi:hypothetical protein
LKLFVDVVSLWHRAIVAADEMFSLDFAIYVRVMLASCNFDRRRHRTWSTCCSSKGFSVVMSSQHLVD